MIFVLLTMPWLNKQSRLQDFVLRPCHRRSTDLCMDYVIRHKKNRIVIQIMCDILDEICMHYILSSSLVLADSVWELKLYITLTMVRVYSHQWYEA